MIKLFKYMRDWARRNDGSATIEFCIWFPFIISIMGSAFEASLISTRQVMMIGALDRTVRDLQLNNIDDLSHNNIKKVICNRTGVIPDCMNKMHIELERISTDDFAFRTGAVQCVDVDEEIIPPENITPGQQNELMLITACASIRPMVPVTGLGLRLPKINGGSHYALVAFSAFVVEPSG